MIFDINVENKQLKVFRDDLYPFLGGGNKGRKMDYIGRRIFSDRYNCIVTTGGIESNHCRAAAIFASMHNMKCTLVLHGDKNLFYTSKGNGKIMRLCGSRILFAKTPADISGLMNLAIENYKEDGWNPYYLWGGGHTVEGGLAYIDAISELLLYSEKESWIPDYIFLASGTGSTQAGIMAGLDKFCFSKTKVIGISVGRNSETAEKMVREFYLLLGDTFNIKNRSQEAVVLDDYLCGGYGKSNEAINRISQEALMRFGFILDPTYTAKAFYGMQELIRKDDLKGNFLFWHTGGIFNFLAK